MNSDCINSENKTDGSQSSSRRIPGEVAASCGRTEPLRGFIGRRGRCQVQSIHATLVGEPARRKCSGAEHRVRRWEVRGPLQPARATECNEATNHAAEGTDPKFKIARPICGSLNRLRYNPHRMEIEPRRLRSRQHN